MQAPQRVLTLDTQPSFRLLGNKKAPRSLRFHPGLEERRGEGPPGPEDATGKGLGTALGTQKRGTPGDQELGLRGRAQEAGPELGGEGGPGL